MRPEYGFGYLFWLGLFVVAGVARFGFMIRHLSVLPLRPLHLNAVLVAWPAAVMVPAWAALLLIYVTVVRQPVTSLSVGVLLSLIGLSALTRSITLRWEPMSMALVPIVFVVGVLSGLPPFWTSAACSGHHRHSRPDRSGPAQSWQAPAKRHL